jgi:hypothetical protein
VELEIDGLGRQRQEFYPAAAPGVPASAVLQRSTP